jgi:hypothetical protein
MYNIIGMPVLHKTAIYMLIYELMLLETSSSLLTAKAGQHVVPGMLLIRSSQDATTRPRTPLAHQYHPAQQHLELNLSIV